MSIAASLEPCQTQRAGDIGAIIAKVQDDLQHLRAAVVRAGEAGVDLQALDLAINRTEKGVQAVAEHILSESQSQVSTLPTVRPQRVLPRSERKSLQELVESTTRTSPIKQARSAPKRIPAPTPAGLTPGQKAQLHHMSRLLSRPTHPVARQVLTEQYSLPTPGPSGPREPHTLPGLLATGPTIDPLTTLPRANRRDAQLTPPTISQEDARKGLLSLLERGLIPPAAEIVLSPPPIQPKTMPLLSPTQQFTRQRVADGADGWPNNMSSHLTGVKLDPTEPHPPSKAISIPTMNRSTTSTSQSKERPALSVKFLEPPASTQLQSKNPPSTPSSTPALHTSHQLVVQNGHVVDHTQEFQLFKAAFKKQWKNIVAVLQQVEELCRNYAIPLAFADGEKISELAAEHELGLKLRREDLLESLINAKDIHQLLRIPGRRYMGARGLHAAAAKIQATFRMFIKRSEYLEYRRKKWATGVITIAWVIFLNMFKVRQRLKKTRAQYLENHRQRTRDLRKRWNQIQQSKRVIIHLPSQGHAQPVRAQLEDFDLRQNLQMARICDVRDPNVEVLYVSPLPVDEEMQDYYHRLLAMGPGGEEASQRVHFITPEQIGKFPGHRMSLSTILLYSTQTAERLRHLTAGREAYIVPNVVSRDDLAVADMLGLPLLGPEPETSQLYSSKAGAKRIFTDADVSIPPSASDIFSLEQLVEQLASLVTNHLLVPRWLFKLPNHVGGRGFAYCEVPSHLECHSWALKESQRYGKKWRKKWAQDYALKRILDELPAILSQYARPVDTELFPTWDDFLIPFLAQGGVIEGCPPSESVTSLTVDLLIEPTGVISIFSMADQIHSAPYQVWGVSIPQTSVDPTHLRRCGERVGQACQARGIIGHLSIDFLTFIHPTTMLQEVWAVDLDLGYSDHLALQQLLSYVTGVKGDWEQNHLALSGGGARWAILAPHLWHTNLSVVQYPIFFQMCRAHHIGYDAKEQTGTLFALVDNQQRDHLGMICLQNSLQRAVTGCSSNLAIIHQEISTPNMQGQSNFQAACRELDGIAELICQNQEEEYQ